MGGADAKWSHCGASRNNVNGYGCIFGCLGSSAVTAQEVCDATSNPHHGGRGGHAHSLAVAAVTTSCDSNNVFAIWFIGMIVVAP